VNYRKSRYAGGSEIRLKRFDQKVWSQAKVGWLADANGYCTPGLKVAPKVFAIMYQAELGKPYTLLDIKVSNRKGMKQRRGQKRGIKSECRICNGSG